MTQSETPKGWAGIEANLSSRIAALERELAEAKAHHERRKNETMVEVMNANARIAALEQTLREVRSLIEPYAMPWAQGSAAWQALALIDRTLEPRDEGPCNARGV